MNEQLPRARCTLKNWHVQITNTREWNLEKRTHDRTSITREVHFQKSDMCGSLPRESGTLKSETMNEKITRARCILKMVTCEDHYLARVELWKANPWTNNYHARSANEKSGMYGSLSRSSGTL